MIGAVGGVLSSLAGLAVIVLVLALLLFFIADAATFGRRLDSIAVERPDTVRALADSPAARAAISWSPPCSGSSSRSSTASPWRSWGCRSRSSGAILAFITNYIPNIGFVFGLVPPALLALLTGGWPLLVAVIVVYCVFNLVIQSLIQPRFIGDSVGLSATVTFVALLFWAWVLGPLGALLAVPLTLLVKALLVDIDPRARWADALLRSTAENPPATA